MTAAETHKWEFKPRFRKNAFGWKSQPAITRIKQAVAEIKKVARKEPALAAEGAVIFFEKISPAIEHVDSSSGAIGSALYRAIEELVPIIAAPQVDEKTRRKWLDRLWAAHEADQMPYIERLADFWGELCASPKIASFWADELVGTVQMIWSDDSSSRGHFHGTSACLSSLYAASRYDELLELLAMDRLKFWDYQQFAVKALAALGRKAEAIQHAESCRGSWTSNISVAQICEEILLSSGFADEAYARYAIEANQSTTHLSTYRSIAKKYPQKQAKEILTDLIDTTPGAEGKWFATAKELGFLELALQLARKSPCDPRTLTRASRDYIVSDPAFAMCAGLSALQWIILGHGYEITSVDIWDAFTNTMNAAEKVGETAQVRAVLREAIGSKSDNKNLVWQVLGRELG
ncbi:hypothetical protein KBF38_24835 [bacterium]|nr:hypothetical protein [bacterium]